MPIQQFSVGGVVLDLAEVERDLASIPYTPPEVITGHAHLMCAALRGLAGDLATLRATLAKLQNTLPLGTVREEWRVTGEPGHGYPSYNFVFGNPYEGERNGTPEERARNFIRMQSAATGHEWLNGPFLDRRTISETEWERVPLDTAPDGD